MKVLVVDDDNVSALVLRRTLERLGHEPTVATNGLDALDLHQKQRYPVVVSDWMMPRMDGLTLCGLIREECSDSYTYFVLLTAKTQQRDRLEALQAGVDDFLTKPLDRAELAARMNVAHRIVIWDRQLRDLNASLVATSKALAEQASELDRMRREAQYLATHDPLTGVLSRRAWFESIAIGEPTAVAVFDVDHFKEINDTHGHPAGDRVLQEVTVRLVAGLAPGGSVGRLGGEEFGVIFDVPLSEARTRCMEVIGAVAGAPVIVSPKVLIPVTISAGLAPWFAGGTFDECLARSYEAADRALYEAKRRGRRRLVELPRAA